VFLMMNRGLFQHCLTYFSRAFCEEDIDAILDRRTVVIKHDNSGAERSSIFSKVFDNCCLILRLLLRLRLETLLK
jgi:hypothetical protein